MQEIKKLQCFPLNAVIEMITFKLFITKFPSDRYRITFLIKIDIELLSPVPARHSHRLAAAPAARCQHAIAFIELELNQLIPGGVPRNVNGVRKNVNGVRTLIAYVLR